jgi:hypothetical protein
MPTKMYWLLYAFFWVIPRCLNSICWHFRTLCLFHLHRQIGVEFYTYPLMKMEQSVLNRWYIKFRYWGFIQKKTCNIQSMAKVWNQECIEWLGFDEKLKRESRTLSCDISEFYLCFIVIKCKWVYNRWQCATLQDRTIQCSAVQYNTIQ